MEQADVDALYMDRGRTFAKLRSQVSIIPLGGAEYTSDKMHRLAFLVWTSGAITLHGASNGILQQASQNVPAILHHFLYRDPCHP